jgi:malate synthase
MTGRIDVHGLKVAEVLFDFINGEALPETGVDQDHFWKSLSALVHDLAPKNRDLLAKRDALQARIDAWHRANPGTPDMAAYKSFLRKSAIWFPEGDFEVGTDQCRSGNRDLLPVPQLVVPVMNARYALNAANARWGSLYDALYGTDAMGSKPQGGGYDEARGAEVIAYARKVLDDAAPLASGSWADITGLAVNGTLSIATDRFRDRLADPAQFAGYSGDVACPYKVLAGQERSAS